MTQSQPQPKPRPSYLSFRDMPVWQTAMAVAEQVFAVTDGMTEDR